METDQTLMSQDDKKWDRPWTTDEIRKNSANWTLAGDVGLYNLLTEISQNIISRTHEVENAVDSLVYRTKMANAKICNTINDFHMLSNLQFVENRVYDEEIQETTAETKPTEKTKEQKEAEMLPKIKKAVELGLEVLDKAFTKIHVDEISDSEDEDISSDGRTILEPKDPYASRPLPFVIGSEEFNNSDYAGLQDLLEEDVEYSVDIESSISESEETTTDEEEPLPLDEDKFTGVPKPKQKIQSESDYSSSEESDLFGSEKAENGFISDSSFDNKAKPIKSTEELIEEKKTERKESKSFQPTNLPQVLPVPKKQEKKKVSDDLFTTDEPSDDESPFRKKTGLFTSGLKFDDDEKDMFSDDLFGEKPKETKKTSESPKPSPAIKTNTTVQRDKGEPDLFGNDEDSDDDIFKTLTKTKAPSIVKENKTSKQSPSDMADSSSTPSSAPSTKPSGNAFDFMSGGGNSDSLFGDESDADDLFSTKKSNAKKFDFDASQDDDDDLFGLGGGKASKKIEVAKPKKSEEKKSSLFEESVEVDKSYKKMGTPLPGLVPSNSKESKPEEVVKPQSSYKRMGQPLPGLVPMKSDSLFENKDSSPKKPSPTISAKKAKDSIFDDSDSSGQEDKPPTASAKQPLPKKKEISLFDDEPDDDDIFSQVPKKLMSPGESPSLANKTGKSQFSKLHGEDKPTKSEKKDNAPSLFEDDEDIFKDEFPSKPTSIVSKTKDVSLFEDSDNFDLFVPKPEVKKSPKSTRVKESLKDDLFMSSDETDTSIISKPVKESLKDDLFKSSDGTDTSTVSKPVSQPVKDNIFADIPRHKEGLSTSKPEVKTVPPSSAPVPSEDSFVGFDAPPDSTKTLHVISKDRAKVNTKRRRPTKKGRMAALEQSEKEVIPETSSPPSTSASSAPVEDLFAEVQKTPSPASQPPPTHKVQEKQKMNLMSQLMNEAAASRLNKRAAPVGDEEEDVDIFAEALNKDRTKSRGFSFNSPIETVAPPAEKVEVKKEEKGSIDLLNSEDADNDDFFAEPSFRNFRSSISHKNSILDDDDDDEDDLFSTIKSSPLKKTKEESTEPDIFADDTDIFAEITKEKYEMFPSNVYDDDGDDIFSIADPLSSNKTNSSSIKPTSTAVTKKEAEKKPVDLFDDPLSGLLGDN